MIKILVACDNDNLFNELNNTIFKVTNVKTNEKNIVQICKNLSPDMLIIDFNNNPVKYFKIIEKLKGLNINKYIIISETQKRVYICFKQPYICFRLIRHIESFNDSTEKNMLEKIVIDMLSNLHFNLYSKGTWYLKDCIYLAYYNKTLLFDTNSLISQVATLHNENNKNIRNNIDNALNLAFDYENLQYDIDFFNGLYDGRKISLKYFMILAIKYIMIKMEIKSDELLQIL